MHGDQVISNQSLRITRGERPYLTQCDERLREIVFEPFGLHLTVIEAKSVIVDHIACEGSVRISDIERSALPLYIIT